MLNSVRSLTRAAFALFLILSLNTPSWRYGPFSWLPVAYFRELAGGPVELGLLNGLPLVVLLGWLIGRGSLRDWTWGRGAVTIPFAAFTVWALLRLEGATPRLIFIYGGAFVLAWFVYLYVLNDDPPLTLAIGIVVVLQSMVAIGQFWWQRDLGLVFLGELPLNPAFEGVTVLSARGTHWLRAYGLTAHPNLLGALLAVLLVLLLPALVRSKGWHRKLLILTVALGLLGLFFSFSRAAWLAVALGLIVWFLLPSHARLGLKQRINQRPQELALPLLPLVTLAIFLFTYHDLALSRFTDLNKSVEARSIHRRVTDARLALEVINEQPFIGTGLGYYVDAATLLNADAERVHNVVLLVTAELGIPGLVFTLLLLFMPIWDRWHLYRKKVNKWGNSRAAYLAPWVVMLVVNQFDTMLWVTGNWQTAILFGLLAAHVARDEEEAE